MEQEKQVTEEVKVIDRFSSVKDILNDERFSQIMDAEIERLCNERHDLRQNLTTGQSLRRTSFDRIQELGLANTACLMEEFEKVQKKDGSKLPTVLRNYVVYIVSMVARMTVNSYAA